MPLAAPDHCIVDRSSTSTDAVAVTFGGTTLRSH